MSPDLKKLNILAMLFALGVACGYILGSLWPGLFFLIFLPFGFSSGKWSGEKVKMRLSYLIATGLGFTVGFLISLVVWITSL